MNETLRLEGLEFRVGRSARRRTVGITVERDGDLSVTAPEGTPLAQVEAAVRGKLFWVFAKLAEKALLLQPAPKKEYVSGEGFHYLGRSYRLLLTNEAGTDGAARVRLTGGRFVLPRAAQPPVACQALWPRGLGRRSLQPGKVAAGCSPCSLRPKPLPGNVMVNERVRARGSPDVQ